VVTTLALCIRAYTTAGWASSAEEHGGPTCPSGEASDEDIVNN